MMYYIDSILSAAVYIVASFILFYAGKWAYRIANPSIDMQLELVEKDNFAFSLSQLGYYAGLLFAIGGVMAGPSKGMLTDIAEIGAYGLLAIVLLNITQFINDRFILSSFSIRKEIIEDQNAGTGAVVGASSAASGLVIMGAVYGDGGGLDTATVFWAVSQIILVGTAKLYTWMIPYDVHELIEKDNVAAGISFAGVLLAIANLIRHATMKNFDSWQTSFAEIGIGVVIGLAFLPVARLLTDKILLPGSSLTHEISQQEKPNCGAALIEAFAYLGGSVLITWCL